MRTGRGGQVTFHGPGQLVGYPIVDLRAHRQDVHWYVRQLEQVVIDALAALGVEAGRVPGLTGVWVEGRRKIASIGVGIRRWVTSRVRPEHWGRSTPSTITPSASRRQSRARADPRRGAGRRRRAPAFVTRFGYERVVALAASAPVAAGVGG